MRNDVKSNYTLAEATAAASHAVGAVNSASVDHADGSSVSFFISLSGVGTGGTLDAKTQYSDNDSDWTDYPASDPAGNDDAITQLTAAGTAQLNVPNPRGRYTRVVSTVATDACVFGITSVLGPLRSVAAE
jgi:hypothetical protein